MTLSELKNNLQLIDKLLFKLPNGTFVPAHFHVTEIGLVQKSYIDCGGTLRNENYLSMQLWNANDYNHQLHPEKLQYILQLSERQLNLPDLPVYVEYQGNTIETYALEFNGIEFELTSTFTDCLAKSSCGVEESSACTPGGGCC